MNTLHSGRDLANSWILDPVQSANPSSNPRSFVVEVMAKYWHWRTFVIVSTSAFCSSMISRASGILVALTLGFGCHCVSVSEQQWRGHGGGGWGV